MSGLSNNIGAYQPDPGRWGRRPSTLESIGRGVVAAGSVGLSAATGNIGGAVSSFLRSGAVGTPGGAAGGGSDLGDFQELLQMQMQAQQRMQMFTAESNLQKTEHEARMAPVRNMRA